MSAREVQNLAANLSFQIEGTGYTWGRDEILQMCQTEAEGWLERLEERLRALGRARR